MFYILKLIKPLRKRIIGVIFLSFLFSLIGVARPYIIRIIINESTKLNSSIAIKTIAPIFIKLIILLIFFQLLYSIFNYITYRVPANTEITTEKLLKKIIFYRLSKLSVEFFETNRSGAILEKINRGANNFLNWLRDSSWMFADNITTLIVSIIFLATVSPLVSLILFLFTLLYSFTFLTIDKKVRPINKKISKHSQKAYSYLTETFTHLTTIRSLSVEKIIQKNYNREIDKMSHFSKKETTIWAKSIFIRDILILLATVSCISIIVYQMLIGKLKAGDLVFVILLTQNIVFNINPLVRFISQTSRTAVFVNEMVEVLKTKPTFKDKKDAKRLSRLSSIEFKNVTFRYPNIGKYAVKNISFKIINGKNLALVGPSGVGKSTITKLLLRFYQPVSGQILINDQDASNFTQESIRQKIGAVLQDVALFNTTIMENLKISYPSATSKQVIASAKQSFADEFIDKLPKKYKTLVGERGVKLSGGQKQRVAIARAILKNPQLIILDEAMSSLDSVSEKLVQSGLKELMKDRPSLTIAHRLSTLMHADEILVLKSGQITERGNHKSLLKRDGFYAKLFKMQSLTNIES
ncbi:MAG: ABC transporter ATP-binding protein [bacterium]|nr:ABC transporter ATP-binding protein [bacterium]